MIEWSEALGILIGVIVGGILTGGLSYVLDRQRHAHDDRVRRAQWEREDKLRNDQRSREDELDNRSHLRDLYVRAFNVLSKCEAGVVSLNRLVDTGRLAASSRPDGGSEERLASLVDRLESYRRELIMMWPEFDVIAPTKTAAPFDRVTSAFHEIVAKLVETDGDRPDESSTAPWRDDSLTLTTTAQQFRTSARQDLGLDDADERGVDRPTAIWGRSPGADSDKHRQRSPAE